MMKKLFPLFCLFSILLFTDCTKEEEDPCAGITCENGGTCINGTCDCPDMYEGADCSDQKTPQLIKITKITVTNFPPLNNGDSWDAFDGPDIFIKLFYNSQAIAESGPFENADSQVEYSWTVTNLNLIAPEDPYTIELYDYDDGVTADDLMGGYTFTPYSDTNGFPDKITLSEPGSSTSFVLELEYQF